VGACDAFCPYPNASSVVTPLGQSLGLNDSSPTLSPDATSVAYVSGNDIVVIGIFSSPGNVTNNPAADLSPAWSPDGQRIAFVSDREGSPELFLMNPDGSDVVRLTTAVGVSWSRPSWSPDSTRLAFGCSVAPGDDDICVIRADGTGLVRLTDDPAWDADPAWSPDGATIAFATSRFGAGPILALMREDGSGVSRIGAGVYGRSPAWSHDGRQIAFDSYLDDVNGNSWPAIYRMNPDGSNIMVAAEAASDPVWLPGAILLADFTAQCNVLTCSVDGSSSTGDIVNYSWDFGDHTTATGNIVSHTYATAGTYTIALTVTSANGTTTIERRTVTANRPPVASFTVSCDDALTCLFNWSGSSDPDGSPLSISLAFGPGDSWVPGPASPKTVLHKYDWPGVYTATLWVSDGLGATTTSRIVTVPTPVMHIADLDASATNQQDLRAALVQIGVHTSRHMPLGNVVVTAAWNDGLQVSCTTTLNGYCAVQRSFSPSKPVTSLTITGVTHQIYAYTAASNHDPDGDSNGTTISIPRR